MKPPSEIAGADVVLWAWSEAEPFFAMPYSDGSGAIPIHGLAICRYAESGIVCRFSCNNRWEPENDSAYDNVEDAVTAESAQYDVRSVQWQRL